MEPYPCGLQLSDSNTSYEVFKMCPSDDPCCGRKIYRGACKPVMPQSCHAVPCCATPCSRPGSPARLSNINPPRPPGGDPKAICVPCGVTLKYRNNADMKMGTPSSFLCLLSQFNLYVPGILALAAALSLAIFNMTIEKFNMTIEKLL